jgi:hypothetical protein
MDSLQVLQLTRALRNKIHEKAESKASHVTPTLIYQNPNVTKLAVALLNVAISADSFQYGTNGIKLDEEAN